ncbi:MAG: DNA primase DnaG [Candidatus Asgardarchaeia archaeon]
MVTYEEENSTVKYLIKARIEVDGIVEKPDVVGAVFGQTEGLLGRDLDLRELQKTGRIGRITVQLNTRGGKSNGLIIIPSSLSMVETSIIAAALEAIDRVGPCSAKVRIEKIEDVREKKRRRIIQRAVEILRKWTMETTPESQEITEEVMKAFQTSQITTYGREKLPAGPNIDSSDTIIIVEGRADVLNLLKHGFTNVIAVEGTSIPQTIVSLSRKKTSIAFVDGDRGGELILKELLQVADIDFIARAPPGKEVEELTYKEILKALRNKIPTEQVNEVSSMKTVPQVETEVITKGKEEREKYVEFVKEVKDKSTAILLNSKGEVMKKVPVGELLEVLDGEDDVHCIVLDGIVTQRLLDVGESKGVKKVITAKIGKISKKPLDIEIKTFDELRA